MLCASKKHPKSHIIIPLKIDREIKPYNIEKNKQIEIANQFINQEAKIIKT